MDAGDEDANDAWCPQCGAPTGRGATDGTAQGAPNDLLIDRNGDAYAWPQKLRLLDSIDAHLAQRVDGSGHAVIEPKSGSVLATGDTADEARSGAEYLAAQLGRRRLQAAIDRSGTQLSVTYAAEQVPGRKGIRANPEAVAGNAGSSTSKPSAVSPDNGANSKGGGSAGVATLSGLSAGVGARQLGGRALLGLLGEVALPVAALGSSLYGGLKAGNWLYNTATDYLYGPSTPGSSTTHVDTSVSSAGGEGAAGSSAPKVAGSVEYVGPGGAKAGPDHFVPTERMPHSPPAYEAEGRMLGIPPLVPVVDNGAVGLVTPIHQEDSAASIYSNPASTEAGRGLTTTYPANGPVSGPHTMLSEFGPESPRNVLGENVTYPDPAPRTYKGDMAPDTPVVDHRHARALGGHPTDSTNLDPRAWIENVQKGGHEGRYKIDRDQLVDQGLTLPQAEWVLEGDLHWIENDIHAMPVDPKKLNKLPSP